MNNMFSKSAIWVVVALLLFMLFKQFDNHSVAGGSQDHRLFRAAGRGQGQRIKDVVIEGRNITATRTDDTKVRTTATMLDRGLVGDLRQQRRAASTSSRPKSHRSCSKSSFPGSRCCC